MSPHYFAKLLLPTRLTFSSVRGRVQVRENEHDIRRLWGAVMLLTEQLLPVMREISGEFFIFQQDSALAQCARRTRENQPTSAFISPDLCFPTSEPS